MSSPLYTSGYSKEPTAMGHAHDEKYLTFAAETVDAGSDSDVSGDPLPESCVRPLLGNTPYTSSTRGCKITADIIVTMVGPVSGEKKRGTVR